MINKKENPVEWAAFMYELEDAKEHLANLITELSASASYAEEELQIDLGHIYAHLNRAWHRRNIKGDFTDEQWKSASQYPTDLGPV